MFSIWQVVSALTLDPSSVESLNKWIDFIRDAGRTEIQVYVVGNKNDLEETISNEGRKIAQEIAEKQAEKYKEVSAKTASNIEELFSEILDSLLAQSNSKKTQPSSSGAGETKANTE